MKKILAVLVALLAFGTIIAEDVGTFSVSGNAQVKWGVDLDYGTTGFVNALDGIQIKTVLHGGEAVAKSGEGMYGMIEVTGVTIEADTGYGGANGNYGSAAINLTWDEVHAKLVIDAATLSFWGTPDDNYNYQGTNGDLWLKNAYNLEVLSGAYAGSHDLSRKSWNSWEGEYAGVYFKNTQTGNFNYTTNGGVDAAYALEGIADLGLKVLSQKTWVPDTSAGATNNTNGYVFAPYFALKAVENLTLNAGASVAVNIEDAPLNMGAKVAYSLAVGDIKITPAFATDVSLSLAAPADAAYFSPKCALTAGVMVDSPYAVLAINGGYNDAKTIRGTATVDVKLVEGLEAKAFYDMENATNLTIAAGGKLGYGIKNADMTITPWVQGSYSNYTYASNVSTITTDAAIFMKAGISVAGVMPNTTFSVEWDSNDLNNQATDALVLGQLYFTTKVSF